MFFNIALIPLRSCTCTSSYIITTEFVTVLYNYYYNRKRDSRNSKPEENFMDTTLEHQKNIGVPEAESDQSTGPNNSRQSSLGLLHCQDSCSTGSQSVTCTPQSEVGTNIAGSTL